MEGGLLLVMNVFVRHALKLISPVKLVAAQPPLNWFKAIRFTLNYSLGLIRSKVTVCEWTALLRADQTHPLERSTPEGPSCETRKITHIKLLLTLCLLQSIITISSPTQSPARV